jgi:uncharacterized protein YjlB
MPITTQTFQLSDDGIFPNNSHLPLVVYPRGQTPDMCYGRPGERPAADGNVAATALPAADPVRGLDGGLLECWQP